MSTNGNEIAIELCHINCFRSNEERKIRQEKLGHLLPQFELQHPFPEVRFALKHPKFGSNIQGRNRVR